MGVRVGPPDQLKGGGAGDGLAEEVMFELRFEGAERVSQVGDSVS